MVNDFVDKYTGIDIVSEESNKNNVPRTEDFQSSVCNISDKSFGVILDI